MSAIVDVAEGVVTKWGATSALTSVIPVSRVYLAEAPSAGTVPYAVLQVSQAESPEYQQPATTGKAYLHRIAFTVEIYANSVSSSADSAAAQVRAAFDGDTPFAVPNSTNLAVWLVEEGGVSVSGTRDGEPIYFAPLKFETLLQRTKA